MNLIYSIAGISTVLVFYSLWLYNTGYNSGLTEYRTSYYTELRKEESKLREASNAAIEEYIKQIEELKKRNEDLTNAKLANTVKCMHNSSASKGVSSGRDKSNLTCYRDTQLREQIKRSLDLARECDSLVLKHNALIKQCSLKDLN